MKNTTLLLPVKTLIFFSLFLILLATVPWYGKIFMLLWYGSLFFQSAFLHRYSAHGQFSMNKSKEKMFFVLTWLLQGASYLSATAYGIIHRLHHSYVDTKDDPHSPSYQKNIMQMMLRTRDIYSEILHHRTFLGRKIDEKYFKNVPEWAWFDKRASSIISRLFWVMVYVISYISIAYYEQVSGLEWVGVGAIMIASLGMAPIHGAIINWWGHIYGYHNHDLDNTSTNISIGKSTKIHWYQIPFSLLMNFLMMGEDIHNNHHARQHSLDFAQKWWELDMTYVILLVFDSFKIITIKRGSL